jgi:hypothetical protein
MTHNDLVKSAGYWLQSAKRCNPIFLEKGSNGCAEIPDAIGWTSKECILVECKTSKADLIANAQKTLVLGNRRYFLMIEELYEECKEHIPEGWGIITLSEHKPFPQQKRLLDSKVFESDARSEIRYLRSRILAIQNYGRL